MDRIIVINVNLAILVPAEVDLDFEDAYVYDAANEVLREHQQKFAPNSCLLDYALENQTACNVSPEDYVEGDAFVDEASKE